MILKGLFMISPSKLGYWGPSTQQRQQQQQRSDPSSARAFAFLFPLRIALKREFSLTAGSVFFISAHASQVL